MENKTKIVVVGGCGYIGSVLVPMLCDEGYEVRVVDTQLFGAVEDRRAKYAKIDVRNPMEYHFKDADVVISIYGWVGDPLCTLNIPESISVNISGITNICETAKRCKVPHLIHISTCSVYGARPDVIFTEEEKEYYPVDLYGMEKLSQEKIVESYFKDFTMFRLGTVFGMSPSQRFDLVINKFIARAFNGEEIMVLGGNQNRPFVHVKDVSRAIIHAIKNKLGGVYNCVNFNMSIKELAERISKKTLCPITYQNQIEDKRNYIAENRKIKDTGFEFKYDLDFAIEELRYFPDLKIYNSPRFDRRKWMEGKR